MMDWTGPTFEPWWQDELDRINGSPGERLSWLKLVWEPGRPWEPVHRWVVYQMRPISATPSIFREALLGEDPLKLGKVFAKDGRLQFEDSVHTSVNHRQWVLFRETGCFGAPYWVVQGSPEGHKYRLDKLESTISQKHGGPKDTPAPGELPYAIPDMRLFRKLLEKDRIRLYTKMLDFASRKPEQFDAEDRDALDEMEKTVSDWLDYRLSMHTDELVSAMRRDEGARQDLGLSLRLGMYH